MERILQTEAECHLTDWERVRDFQRKLYRKAKQEKDFRFYVLYDKVCSERFLREGYRKVRANNGSPGADGISFEEIEREGTENFLQVIAEELRNETYKPSPVLRVYIGKTNGKLRSLGIPTIRDRIVQMACKLVIEPIFEADFEDSSYGFRPKRSAGDAVTKIKENLKNGAAEVFDADLSAYFDTIPHDNLMKLIGMRISDRKVLHLIKMWLKTPICENGRIHGGKKNKKGTPQGGVISPLLANIYLHLMDKIINKEGGIFRQLGIKIVRYADDFILMGKALPAYITEKLNLMISRMKLTLNEEKSRQVNAYKEAFDFLGFTFSYDRSLYNPKQRYWNVRPSKKSENKLREKLRKYFVGCRHYTTEKVVKGINLITRGWLNYFHIPKVSYLRKSCENLEYYMERKFYRHFAKKSQRKCRLFHKCGFVRQMEKYGLFSPIRMLKPANA